MKDSMQEVLLRTIFDEKQLQQIMSGQKDGLDFVLYMNPRFTWKQMNQIRMGLYNDLDVSKILDPSIKHTEMHDILFGRSN